MDNPKSIILQKYEREKMRHYKRKIVRLDGAATPTLTHRLPYRVNIKNFVLMMLRIYQKNDIVRVETPARTETYLIVSNR